jgi:hypothetical protein
MDLCAKVAAMNETDIPNQELAALAHRLRQLSDTALPVEGYAGRGIVIAAGGSTVFTNAYVLISVLRRTLGCRLPIEVWHYGAAEMSPTMTQLLKELDAETVDALPRIAAAGLDLKDGWQLKPFCLQHCRFEEVLLLDADQVPLVDPSGIFDWPEYRQTGAVFWPDTVGLRTDNPVWQAMGLAPETPEISFDSGQILVDKRRHWKALSTAVALNQAAALIYRYLYGDKDTFLLAFRLADDAFSLIPHAPFRAPNWMAQRDFSGAALFQHLTNSKWSYSSNDSPGEGFQLYEACREALQHLRQRWNGHVFNAPDRPPAARDMEADLTAAGLHRLEVIGEEQAEIELLPFGEIGVGRSLFRQNWWCEAGKGEIRLLIRDADRVTYRLTLQDNGSWAGLRHARVASTATLTPAGTRAATTFGGPGLADELLRAISFPHHSEADWARLCATLEILARVDPKVLSRLRTIAGGFDAPAKDALLRVVDAVEGQPASRRSPHIDLKVLNTRYRPLIDLSK